MVANAGTVSVGKLINFPAFAELIRTSRETFIISENYLSILEINPRGWVLSVWL
jgi:hypothetical protein